MRKYNLAGRRFGRLLVLYECDWRKNEHILWHCRCDCGNEVDVVCGNLTSGHTKSCGCYSRECTVERSTIHGMNRRGERHPIHHTWQDMLQRCENPNNSSYHRYGGRGITVCDEWHNPVVFADWALANNWEKGLQLDRIDNNGNYEPSNCRWATRKEQARNRRNNSLITFNGKTQTMAEWAEETGIKIGTLWARINQTHWPIERALTEPARRQKYAS